MNKPIYQPHNNAPAGGRGAIVAALRAYQEQAIPIKILSAFAHGNKIDGFDCPGCAFPDKPGKPLIDSCEQGQKAIAWEMTRKQTGADFFAGKTPEDLQALSDHELEAHGRLVTPILYQRESHAFSAISWEDAYAIIGREMRAIAPSQAAFYASGRSSNEAAFLWQLAARSYGCANLPDSSNFCHEPSGFALKQSIGVGKGTCALDDFEHAELIMVLGQNPASNHPRMMVALYEAAQRGATVLVFNPLPERGFSHFSDPKNISELLRNKGVAVAKRIYPVLPGGDLAALKGVIKSLLEREHAGESILDEAFIATHTQGVDELRADIAATSWSSIETESGLSRAQMEEVALHYARSKASMITWCMGITHHENAVATIQYIVNLLLLKGNIGKPGAGALPVRGHSNVQGDRTMGATSSVSAAFLDNMQNAFPGNALTRASGLNAGGVIEGLLRGEIKALLSLGGNFGLAAPDSTRVLQALARSAFTLHIATKLNRTHCYPGKTGLLLPTLGRTDIDRRAGSVQFVTTEDSMSVVRSSRGVQEPIDALNQLSEPAIVAQLGASIARASAAVPWLSLANDYARIRDEIERCQQGVYAGFEHFNQQLRVHGRIQLPNRAAQRQWATASGKAGFRVHALAYQGALQRARAEHGAKVLALISLRSHDQFNTTVYSQDDRYRGVFGTRKVVFMNGEDMRARDLSEGDSVDIETCSEDGIERRVQAFQVRTYPIPRGCIAAYYPETSPLVAYGMHSMQTQTPAYKEVPVQVYASATQT